MKGGKSKPLEAVAMQRTRTTKAATTGRVLGARTFRTPRFMRLPFLDAWRLLDSDTTTVLLHDTLPIWIWIVSPCVLPNPSPVMDRQVHVQTAASFVAASTVHRVARWGAGLAYPSLVPNTANRLHDRQGLVINPQKSSPQ